MKISEVTENIMQDFEVSDDGPNATKLKNKNGVEITVPKKAGKQGMIKPDEKGGFVLDDKANGKSDDIPTGTKVKVQPGGMGTNKRSF